MKKNYENLAVFYNFEENNSMICQISPSNLVGQLFLILKWAHSTSGYDYLSCYEAKLGEGMLEMVSDHGTW